MAQVFLGPSQDADFFSGRTDVVENSSYQWRSHWLHDWSLLATLAGHGKISLGEHSFESEPGEMILIAPEHPHLFQAEPGWNLIWFHFLMRPHLTAEIHWPEEVPGLRRCRLTGTDLRRTKAALLEALQLDHRRAPGWHGLAYALLEEAIMRGFAGDSQSRGDGREWLARAQRLLLQGPEESISVDRIATLCCMSRTKFYTAFKEATGVSPRAWREFQQLLRAQFLLQSTSLPVAEIVRQLGLGDPFYFSTRFRRFCGQSPTEYRRNHPAPEPDETLPEK